MEAEIREFEYNIQAMVKTHQMSPEQGFGFDVQEITKQYDALGAKIQEIFSRGDLTAQQINSVNQLFNQIQLRGRAAAADYTEKMVAANQAIADKYAAPYKALF